MTSISPYIILLEEKAHSQVERMKAMAKVVNEEEEAAEDKPWKFKALNMSLTRLASHNPYVWMLANELVLKNHRCWPTSLSFNQFETPTRRVTKHYLKALPLYFCHRSKWLRSQLVALRFSFALLLSSLSWSTALKFMDENGWSDWLEYSTKQGHN